ncbi:MAG: cytochrome c [Candidatus Sumerlaeaceae bacterium]|nr:cytochrome c [Candidatus Sumerlaeaceae bacterium]
MAAPPRFAIRVASLWMAIVLCWSATMSLGAAQGPSVDILSSATIAAAAQTTASKWTLGSAESPSTGSASALVPPPDDAARLYVQSCAGCHSIGKGVITGPDLARTAAWAEADIATAVKRMEKNVGPLEPEKVQGLVKLLKDPKVQERLADEEQRAAKVMLARMEKPSRDKGDKLFHGETALVNGGMACVSCHAIGGGASMGPDLTHVFKRMGQVPLESACEQTAFKVMNAAYRDHKVTKQEAMHLTAYLKAVDENPPVAAPDRIPLGAVVGVFAGLGGIGYVYGTRRTTARSRLARRR